MDFIKSNVTLLFDKLMFFAEHRVNKIFSHMNCG